MTDALSSSDHPPFFVAYVYPGWHFSPYRPSVDEWKLLDAFLPYFEGHETPPQPRDGRYDDSRPETALKQMREAKTFGIDAFTYFTYYEPNGFVLSEPVDAAFDVADQVLDFQLSLTWCIRLPHAEFPLTLADKSNEMERLASSVRQSSGVAASSLALDQIPIERLTLADVERILGSLSFTELTNR